MELRWISRVFAMKAGDGPSNKNVLCLSLHRNPFFIDIYREVPTPSPMPLLSTSFLGCVNLSFFLTTSLALLSISPPMFIRTSSPTLSPSLPLSPPFSALFNSSLSHTSRFHPTPPKFFTRSSFSPTLVQSKNVKKNISDPGHPLAPLEDKLIRALNAFVHATEGDPRMGYVQGMNTICGAFLYVLPEVEAYYCYERFIRFHVPRYVYPSLDGVHTGTKLLDDVLEKVDPELHKHLLFKGLTAKIYGFASLLSFSAATPPLDELVKLWDFYLAFGAHLNVVAVAAQVVLIRKELLASDSPMKLLRKFPNLRSRAIIAETVRLVKLLDDKLYERLLKHAYEEPAEESAIKSPPAPAPPSTAASASSSSATNASTTSTTTPSSSSNSGAPAVPAAPKAAAT